jgi:HEAT repeat protein
MLMRNWLLTLIIAIVLLTIGLFVIARSRSGRAAQTPPTQVKEAKDSSLKEAKIGQAAFVEPAKTPLEAATTPVAEQVLTPAIAPPVVTTEEAAVIEGAPVVAEETVEVEAVPAPDIAEAEAQVNHLLDGEDFDESIVGAPDSETRLLIAVGLLSALAGRHEEKRERAREAFVKYGYFDEATFNLRTADAPAERAAAARHLGLVGDKAATPHLVAALEDSTLEVRCAAAGALAEVKDPSAIEPLQALLERERHRKKAKRVDRGLIERAIMASAAVQTVETPASIVEAPATEIVPAVEAVEEAQAVEESSAMLESAEPAVAETVGETAVAEAAAEELAPTGAEAIVTDGVEEAMQIEPPAVEAEAQSVEAEARRRFEEEERLRVEEEARQRAEAERIRQEMAEEAARRRAEAEAQRQAEAEAARVRAEEEARRQAEEEERLRAEEAVRQRAAEEERLRAEEEARRLAEAEAARVQAEAEARRLAEEEEEARRLAEEERLRLAEEERIRAEEEARLLAEKEARIRAEEEQARLLAEEEARLRAEEEAARARAEAEERQRAEAETARLAFEIERGEHVEPEIAPVAPAQVQEAGAGDWFDVDISEEPGAGLQPALDSESAPVAAVEESVDVEPVAQAGMSEPVHEPYAKTLTGTESFPSPSAVEEIPESTALAELVESEVETDRGIAEVEEDFSTVPNTILRRLGSEEVGERATAVEDLARIGSEDAFREISAAFDDPAQDVRDAAARSLFNFDRDRAASFTRALREAPPERRRNIGAALSSSGLAAEAISNLMGESREKTYDAFSLLFLMSKTGEVRPLIRAIEEHPNNEVRLAVVKLLALSGQQEILPAFRRLAVRGSLPTEVRSAVMEAIYQLSSQASSDTPVA